MEITFFSSEKWMQIYLCEVLINRPKRFFNVLPMFTKYQKYVKRIIKAK